MMERRQCKRAELDVMVNNSILTRASVSNVSENGICINTHNNFSKGNILVLDFTLPDNTEIKAYGKVKWHQENPDGTFLNGLEFWHLEQEFRDKLSGFVKIWSHPHFSLK